LRHVPDGDAAEEYATGERNGGQERGLMARNIGVGLTDTDA
jgi:hypothetical protein